MKECTLTLHLRQQKFPKSGLRPRTAASFFKSEDFAFVQEKTEGGYLSYYSSALYARFYTASCRSKLFNVGYLTDVIRRRKCTQGCSRRMTCTARLFICLIRMVTFNFQSFMTEKSNLQIRFTTTLKDVMEF